MRHMSDGRQYEILYDLPAGEYNCAEVGGIRTRTIRAGDSLEIECFPLIRVSQEAKRELQRRRTRPAQDAINKRNAEKKVRRYLEHNFDCQDYVVHPTWNYGPVDRGAMNYKDTIDAMERAGLPFDEDDARRAVKNYIKRIKYHVKRRGEDPGAVKWLYVLEVTREPRPDDPCPLPPRYHFHMVIHAPGLSHRDLEDLWPHGYTKPTRLDFRDNGLAGLASYITKQRGIETQDRAGRRVRRWEHSRNLAKPAEHVSDRKLSRRRAALVARDVQQYGREIFEKLYPGYQCMETPVVKYSDFVAGAYIYARLRRIEPRLTGKPGRKPDHKCKGEAGL